MVEINAPNTLDGVSVQIQKAINHYIQCGFHFYGEVYLLEIGEIDNILFNGLPSENLLKILRDDFE